MTTSDWVELVSVLSQVVVAGFAGPVFVVVKRVFDKLDSLDKRMGRSNRSLKLLWRRHRGHGQQLQVHAEQISEHGQRIGNLEGGL